MGGEMKYYVSSGSLKRVKVEADSYKDAAKIAILIHDPEELGSLIEVSIHSISKKDATYDDDLSFVTESLLKEINM